MIGEIHLKKLFKPEATAPFSKILCICTLLSPWRHNGLDHRVSQIWRVDLSLLVWPELPIPTTGQKDRGLWGREWAYLIESSHSRLQGPRSFWSEGPSQRSRFLVLTKGAGPLGTGIKRLVIEPNRTIVIPTKSNSRLPNGRQSYSIKRAITELLFVWFWCSNINNDNKMAKYYPIIKQVNILRKFCTLKRPPYPHRILC